MSTRPTDQIVPHPYAYGAHSPERRQFSTLCYRGWCDNSYRNREIAAMIGMLTGREEPVPTDLPARQCPAPGACQCECHDERDRRTRP